MTPHSPAFAAALAAVSALLGAPREVMRVNGASIAEWDRNDPALVEIDDAEDHITLTACSVADELRVWRAPVDIAAAVREACAWLRWEVPA